MFSHTMIGTNNLDRSKPFDDAALGTLHVEPGAVDRHRVFRRTPIDGKPATLATAAPWASPASRPVPCR